MQRCFLQDVNIVPRELGPPSPGGQCHEIFCCLARDLDVEQFLEEFAPLGLAALEICTIVRLVSRVPRPHSDADQ